MGDDQPHDRQAAAFPAGTVGLPTALPVGATALADGASIELRIAPVLKQLGQTKVRMLAYNGSIPGPTLRVREGSTITVNVVNDGDLDATVHWHGLRLDNRYDGTHETQQAIPVGASFSYQLVFPDPGIYWYHPHIREDYGQELGLYGNILVEPLDAAYWPAVHREVIVTLDDVLIEDGRIASFSATETTYAAMGRFGNVMLVAGETELTLDVQRGEVVRLYLTNTANTRVFNVRIPGALMKLVGGDSGRCEREELVESVILAPSERVVIDAMFDGEGRSTIEHQTPERRYVLGTIEVGGDPKTPSLTDQFATLRENAEWADERDRLSPALTAPPEKTLSFVAEMDLGVPDVPYRYTCPMHPDVVGDASEHCPKCGMKLVATPVAVSYVCPMHPQAVGAAPGRCPECGMKLIASVVALEPAGPVGHDDHESTTAHGVGIEASDPTADELLRGIEWEDDMVEVNRATTPANMRWQLVDRDTGAVNHEIDWRFRVGDQVKVRLVNELDSDHPMHHPFHVHGAGRFVVVERDGIPQDNLVWKDTVLVRAGETVDILLDVTNPGLWMAHCHIAEHHESGMMFSFRVEESQPAASA